MKSKFLICNFSFFIVFFLFHGCASLRYPSTYMMTPETVRASEGAISVHVPMGWFNSTDPAAAPGLLIWLVKKDYSAAITLTELHTDLIGTRQLANDGLETLAMVSYSLKKERVQQPPEKIIQDEIFSINGRKYCSYEYSLDHGKTIERVVVFAARGKWYELSAVPFPKKGKYIDHEGIFNAQNSVLATLRD